MTNVTKDTLLTATDEILGGDVESMTLDRLHYLITVTQFATDLMLNEIERRGELTWMYEMPVVPYMSDHSVQTVLTRP